MVAALAACAHSPDKAAVRRFLRGLSSDELQYIAGFLGERILESAGANFDATDQCHRSADCPLKMILVREYLSRAGLLTGMNAGALKVRAAGTAE